MSDRLTRSEYEWLSINSTAVLGEASFHLTSFIVDHRINYRPLLLDITFWIAELYKILAAATIAVSWINHHAT